MEEKLAENLEVPSTVMETNVINLTESQNNIIDNIAPNNEADVIVSNDVKVAYDGHRSLVANYESDSSSDSDGTVDSEPDSSGESSESSASSSEESIVDKIIKPVEDITITVSKDEAQVMGDIKYIVDYQVIVQPRSELPALDLATILFLDEGARALGKIEDVIGPITEPIYCVNFSSAKDIELKQIKAGMTVYYAPKTDHTAYVPLPTLMKQKGSDASWEHNEEVPDEFKDFSDDEEEAQLNQTHQKQNKTQRRNPRNWFEKRGRGCSNMGGFQRNMQPHPPNMYQRQMQPFPPRGPTPNYNMPPGYFYPQVLPPPPPPPPLVHPSFFPHPPPDFSSPPPMPHYHPPNR